MKKARAVLAFMLFVVVGTAAHAAVDVTVYRLQAGRYIRVLWADTTAELPTVGVTEGAMAWDKGTATLLCWDGAAWIGCSSGGSGAPTSAEYIVAALHAGLSAERVGTDTTEIDWDFGTAGQAKLNLIDDSIAVGRLKTSDTPADGECLTYVAAGDEVAFGACGGAGASDHGALTGLGDDDHSQYALLAGRASGQTLNGGTSANEDLVLCANGSGSYPCVTLDDAASNSVRIETASASDTVFTVSQGGVSTELGAGDNVSVIDSGATTIFRMEQTGQVLGVKGRIRLGDAVTDASASCAAVDTDRLYGDKDCDGTKDAGEEYLDNAAGSGSAITLDLGDDGGNDSTALAEIAVVNDNGGAFTEPSADKLKIDVAKLRPASANNPLESAATWACEMDDLCSGTLVGLTGTSNPVSGTINLLASVTPDPVYSFSFIPGKLCVQSDESTEKTIDLYWSRTPATNATFLMKVDWQNRNLSGAIEGTSEIGLKLSSDSNESVWSDIINGGGGFYPRIYVENNGVYTVVNGSSLAEVTTATTTAWMVLWKSGNTYYGGWMAVDDGLLTPLPSVTKTTVTSFDELHVRFLTANETPSIVWCVDYVRYYDSLVFSFVNE